MPTRTFTTRIGREYCRIISKIFPVSKEKPLHGVFQDVLIHSSDEKIAEISRNRILNNLEVASTLKASQVVFHGNFNPLVKAEYKNNWVERNTRFWLEILDQFDITILLKIRGNQHQKYLENC